MIRLTLVKATVSEKMIHFEIFITNNETSWRFVVGVTVEQFEEAKNKLSHLKKDPGNDVKLKIYALFKQVGGGPDVH